MPSLRRTRGALLRFVRRRRLAATTGAVMAGIAAWVEFSGDFPWWTHGLALVLGATGVALFWTGVVGAPPDWIDES